MLCSAEHAIIFTTRLHCNKNRKDIYNKRKVLYVISTKFSRAIQQSKSFNSAFGDTKEHPTLHMHMMFLRWPSSRFPWPSSRFLPAIAHMAQALFQPSNFIRKCPSKFSFVVKLEAACFAEFEGPLY